MQYLIPRRVENRVEFGVWFISKLCGTRDYSLHLSDAKQVSYNL